MNKNTCFFLLLLLITLAAPREAAAQFWKNWFKKEEPKRRPVKKAAVNNTAAKPKPVKKQQIDYPATVMKKRYRIDVLLPLYLDELVQDEKPTFKDRIPEKAAAGIGFYQGVKLAADTLDRSFYKVDVYIHDIGAQGSSPAQLIKSKKLDSSDLLIGGVPTNEVPELAAFAQKRKINFISVFSPSDAGVKDNPYFTLLQPSLQTNCEWLRKMINKKYQRQKVVLYERQSVPVDASAYRYFAGGDDKPYQKINCNTLPGAAQLRAAFDSTRTNVIVMPVLDVSYAESLVGQLYKLFPGYNFEVYGMPTWKSMNDLRKADAFPNVAVFYTAPFYYDATTSAGQAVAGSFHRAFNGKPSELVYRGYETLNWYAYLLMKYGTIFNTKMNDNGAAPFTRFEVKPQWTSDMDLLYNENQHLYLFRYQSGSYMVEQ